MVNPRSPRIPTLPQLLQAAHDAQGKTPAEAAGITIEGENKWETVIQNAAYLPRLDREETSR